LQRINHVESHNSLARITLSKNHIPMISCLLTLLISITLSHDTGLAQFYAPLAGTPQTTSITKSSYGHEISNSRASIFLTAGSVNPNGLCIDVTSFPPIRSNRWGYPDEVVYGRFGSRYLGLKIHKSVYSASQVLDEFDSWTRSMTPAQIPAFAGLDHGSITTDTQWNFPHCLRLVESLFRLVPSFDHASVEIKPMRGGLNLRAVGTVSTDSTLAQMLIQINPRPSSRRADFFSTETVGPNTRAFLFATDSHLVRVEVTPARAVIDDVTDWRSSFPAP